MKEQEIIMSISGLHLKQEVSFFFFFVHNVCIRHCSGLFLIIKGTNPVIDQQIIKQTNSCSKKVFVPYPADSHYNKSQFGNILIYAGISNSTGLTHVNSQQKEGTASGHEKQIVPYARKQGKKTSKGEHNLSYVHGVEGAIVPHPESLNSTKKKLLGRVNLDPRDITMWTLITQEASDFGSEKVDVNTEKWWAHEREIFRVRIDAFNARMHLILGKAYYM